MSWIKTNHKKFSYPVMQQKICTLGEAVRHEAFFREVENDKSPESSLKHP